MNKLKYNFYLAASMLCLFLVFTAPSHSYAQTTLALGDIAFTGYNCTSSPDEFSFVILKSTGITAGTTIFFTDRNWKSGSCGTNNFCSLSDNGSYLEDNDGVLWTSGTSLSYGAQVKISGTSASNGSVTGTALNLQNSGDQIFALQNGAGSTTLANGYSGTMLTAIHANRSISAGCSFSTANWDNCTTNIATDICASTANSNKPACLTTGTNCIVLLDGSSNEVDNGVYNCTGAGTGTSAAQINAMRTAINTITNWTTQNTTAVTLPPAACSPLPVTWISFDAQLTDNGSLVEWSTSSERNSSHYDIERSFDAVNWQKVGLVAGAGTKYTPSTYYFQDEFNTATYKFAYYRIRQVDFDGRFEYTPIRVAGKKEVAGYTAFSFNGNPLSEATYLKTFLPTAGEAHIEITDSRGNALYSKTFDYTGGYNRFMFNEQVPHIMNKPGIYFVRARIEGEERVFKLVVQ